VHLIFALARIQLHMHQSLKRHPEIVYCRTRIKAAGL
jgi:hypothetical protein